MSSQFPKEEPEPPKTRDQSRVTDIQVKELEFRKQSFQRHPTEDCNDVGHGLELQTYQFPPMVGK